MDDFEEDFDGGEVSEVHRLMTEHDIDRDTAERAQEFIEDGMDEDEAIELAGEL